MAFGSIHFRRPTFTLQVILLVLPLVVLSTIGFISLRQDKTVAEHEAAVRAQAIADDLLVAFQSELAVTNAHPQTWPCVFELDEASRLAYPPAVLLPLAPRPLDEAALTLQQRALWDQAQSLEIQETNASAVAEAYKAFVASAPPVDFEVAGRYSLGLAFANANQDSAAIEVFNNLVRTFPNAVNDSGLPLAPLAQLKSIELSGRSGAAPTFLSQVDDFCSNAIAHPSLLSPTLLDEALRKVSIKEAREKIQEWQEVWQQEELSREVAASALLLQQGTGDPLPQLFWVVTTKPGRPSPTVSDLLTNIAPADFNWLVSVRSSASYSHPPSVPRLPIPLIGTESNSFAATVIASGPSRWFLCQTESQLDRRFFSIVNSVRRIPDYMGVSIDVVGKKLTGPPPGLRLWHEVGYFGRRGGGVKREYLAESATKVLASATQPGAGTELLSVSVWLTSPEILYRNQRARTFWFAAIIGVSSLGAALGLVALWRGFSRQVQLSELKSNFVSSVSHELRAPIASVRLMAESLEHGKVSEPQKQAEYFRFIGQECRRLSSLIENVLDFARIEQGRKQYEFEPTDILALMRQTIALMEPAATERQVTLTMKTAPTDGDSFHPVLDGHAIQQALVNLIDNAIKHSKPGQEVTVGLEDLSARDQNGETPSPGEFQLWVEDAGAGIAREEQQKIFERFYRLGSELRRDTPGVGIGLSIVKHIVQAHHGRIEVRSAPGDGSRFTIYLPESPDDIDRSIRS
jgi:signal transduction histidine kinase